MVIAFNACSGGERQIAGPGGSDDVPSTATLQVEVEVAPEDAELAGALGWGTGVPGAGVHLLRNGTATWEVRQTDGSGRVVFDVLVPGRYRLYASRRLTESESQSAGGGLRAFGDGRTLDVTSGENPIELALLADRPGSLVISEIGRGTPPPWEVGGSCFDGMYIEVYNNSPATLHLDRMVFGIAYPFGYSDWDHTPCAESQPIREDPEHVHARWFLQFPGSGSEHPILSGEAKVVAVAALDHTSVHPDLIDLSGADFEIGGDRTANNPAVPDMRDIGLEPLPLSILLATQHGYFLSEAVDPQALPIAFRDGNGKGYVPVPQSSIVDFVGLRALWPDQNQEHPPCIPFAAQTFERYEGGFSEIGFGIESPMDSYSRRLLRMEGGRAILQNTNTTAADFELGPRTPGQIP